MCLQGSSRTRNCSALYYLSLKMKTLRFCEMSGTNTGTNDAGNTSPKRPELLTERTAHHNASPKRPESPKERHTMSLRNVRNHSPSERHTTTRLRNVRNYSPNERHTTTRLRNVRNHSPNERHTATRVRNVRNHLPNERHTASSPKRPEPLTERTEHGRQHISEDLHAHLLTVVLEEKKNCETQSCCTCCLCVRDCLMLGKTRGVRKVSVLPRVAGCYRRGQYGRRFQSSGMWHCVTG
jgi:hypothetical protein